MVKKKKKNIVFIQQITKEYIIRVKLEFTTLTERTFPELFNIINQHLLEKN